MKDGIEVYQVITANRLGDGAVVFLSKPGEHLAWSTHIREAAVFQASDIDRMLKIVDGFVTDNVVIGPYAIEVTANRKPLSRREFIRANGPTVKFVNAHEAPPEPEFII